MKRALQVAAWLSLGTIAGSVAPAHSGPRVTVYSRDLGFVSEARTLNLARDRDTVTLEVPERVDFSSVRLAPEGARVLGMAYRFDVASGDGALERARGSRVRVMMEDERTVEGTLVAVDGAWLLVREDQGALHSLARSAVHDVSMSAAGRLAMRPELEVTVEGKKGRVPAQLSYLTGGLSWNADHMLVRRGEGSASWSSIVNVTNQTGRTFEDATLKLVAGEPNRGGGQPPMPRAEGMAYMSVSAEKSADLSQESFSEYHLYTLQRPATLRDKESQALTMLEPRDVKTAPRYRYRGGDPRGVRLQLEIQNRKTDGLGVPLPGGRVRIYEADASGDLQFAGEASMPHRAEDEKLTLDVGYAFDLPVERKDLAQKRISDRERQYTIEIKLRNRKKTPVEVIVEEGLMGDSEVLEKTHEFTRVDANTIEFKIPIVPGQESVLRYTARVRY